MIKRICCVISAFLFLLALSGCHSLKDDLSQADYYDFESWEAYYASEFEQSTVDSQATNAETAYIANKNSKKFHKSNCSAALQIKEENREYSADRNYFADKGYSPCTKCNP